MVYDSKNRKVIVFGGRNSEFVSATLLNNTWSYDLQLNEWEQVHPEVAPSSRMSSCTVYDSHNHKVILFGGSSDVSGYFTKNDTWNYEYDENNWTEVASSVVLPENTSGFEGMALVVVFFCFMIRKYRKSLRDERKSYD